MEYEIDGKTVNVGTASTATVDDQTVTTVIINEKFIEDTLAAKGDNSEILIPLASESDVVISEFGGDIINNMEQKHAEIKLITPSVAYILPADQIKTEVILKQLGPKRRLMMLRFR